MSLVVDQISKNFQAVRVLKKVSLAVQPGEVHGLIGPNGSGKTTLLNIISGYYRPTVGELRLRDQRLTDKSAKDRAPLGIARTFQKPRILESLSTVQNAMVGGWHSTNATFLDAALGLKRARREYSELHDRSAGIVAGVGLGYALDWPAERLTHAERRFLEIARALMLGPRFILLDEPAGGLTGAEIARLGELLQLIASSGIGLLLIEHHTDFVFSLAKQVTVLDFGEVISVGPPEHVRNDGKVVQTYLGQ